MSRESRRRATAGGAAVAERPGPGSAAGTGTPPPGPRVPEHDPELSGFPRVHPRAVLIGLVVGQLVLLVVTNGGLVAADRAFGSQDRLDGGIVGTATFLAVLVGGLLAARLAGRHGTWQGMMVGIGFIVVAIVYSFADEVRIVHDSFQVGGGAHSLVDLGPMRIDQVITGDLLALFGGSVGGFLARRR